MGQGYSLTTLSAGSAGIDVPELADLTYEKNLGEARFMKAVRARHSNGLAVAKVVMKPYASMKFERYIKQIERERQLLFDVPNALGYHRALETSSNGFLVRQFIYSSLYDRLSTRPFLDDIEKRWLAFQLLSAVRDCHARGVYHGDIKTENTLVTSWNWLYLADFSSAYKPTYLPEDNPAEFSFYFDTSGRRTCYLAPERFLAQGEDAEGQGGLTWAMDIFSVGCVIAEIFLESPIFNLSQLFNYRTGDYDPSTSHLSRIEDDDVRELVAHMIQLEPESRYSADEYLNYWRHKVFPEYFYSFLHQYMYMITDPTSGRSAPAARREENNGESDDRVDRLFNDFDKIAFFLGYDEGSDKPAIGASKQSTNAMFPLCLDVPNRRQFVRPLQMLKDDGTLLFLNIATSALRSTARSTTRIRACELLLVFSQRLTDEAKLDRVLPYLMIFINDPSDLVKVAALRSLAQLLNMVSLTSPINAYLFPEYLRPRLEDFSPPANRKLNPTVRATYASCLAALAESASRFLDLIQILKAEGAVNSADSVLETGTAANAYQDLYDGARTDLVEFFERQTKAYLTDPSTEVRRAFLGSVCSLCVFFGSARANDVILSHLNTYLNDRDWRLKCSFFETIVGIAIYIGGNNLEEFILPLMVQALTDPEDTVVEKVLRSLATMAELGLIQRSRTWELVNMNGRFLIHPNSWIREAVAFFISASTRYVTAADCACIMEPLLQPYLRIPPKSFAEADLLDALTKPLPRQVLEMADMWAVKGGDSAFWKPAQQRGLTMLGDDRLHIEPSVRWTASHSLSKVYKTEEDQQWLHRLRNCGMTTEDEVKLVALREYIWRSARQKNRDATTDDATGRFNRKINVSSLGISLETVFFDQQERNVNVALQPSESGNDGAQDMPQTIADALLDASTTGGLDGTRTLPKPVTSARHAPRVASPLAASPSTTYSATDLSRPSSRLDERTGQSKASPRPADTSRRPTPTSLDRVKGLQHEHPLRPKGSAINLMQNAASVSKAEAEISTSPASAVGKIDGHYGGRTPPTKAPFSLVPSQRRDSQQQRHFGGAHNYSGRDPNVLKLLNTVSLDNFPMDNLEFGPLVTPVRKRVQNTGQTQGASRRWRPSGSLVAVFGEHTASITRILPSPDHLFFLTASEDGSIKVWDTARLEQNLTHRSKQTYRHDDGVYITGLCFIENTHCFVNTGSDGSIHVVKVDRIDHDHGIIRYSKLRTLRRWTLPDTDAHAVWVEHFREDAKSILMIAASNCKVYVLDLRSMEIIYELDNPVQHGTITCFLVDPKRLWVLLGTSTGCLDLWDLRFRVRLRGWSMSGTCPIYRLYFHPAPPERHPEGREQGPKQAQKLICIAGGTSNNEITVWDLEEASCAAVYRTSSTHSSRRTKRSDASTSYTLTDIDSQPTSSLLSQLTASLPSSDSPAQTSQQTNNSIRALAVGTLSTFSTSAPSEPYVITAGPDTQIRFWDLDRIERSCIVSGTPTPSSGDPSIWNGERTVFRRSNAKEFLPIFEERHIDESDAAEIGAGGEKMAESAAGMVARSRPNVGAKRSTASTILTSIAGTGASSNDNAAAAQEEVVTPTPASTSRQGREREKEKDKGRTSMISEHQQKLLRSHLDVITDVAVLEWPKRMVVSGDRGGVVFVFA